MTDDDRDFDPATNERHGLGDASTAPPERDRRATRNPAMLTVVGLTLAALVVVLVVLLIN